MLPCHVSTVAQKRQTGTGCSEGLLRFKENAPVGGARRTRQSGCCCATNKAKLDKRGIILIIHYRKIHISVNCKMAKNEHRHWCYLSQIEIPDEKCSRTDAEVCSFLLDS